jgi:hypothetical protein
MSKEDVHAGVRWFQEVAAAIDQAAAGILCVTRSNLGAPWLHFEAGALAKQFKGSELVCPYLYGLRESDLPPESPLSQFQAKQADKQGTLSLLRAINARLPDPLPESHLEHTFDTFWGQLAATIGPAAPSLPSRPPASAFLFLLGDEPAEGFANIVEGAKCVSLLARSAVNLFNLNFHVFDALAGTGCKVRLLLVDPDVASFIFTEPGILRDNTRTTARNLLRLLPRAKGTLEVRVTSCVPTMSLVVVDKGVPAESTIRAQPYLYSCHGSNRPHLRVDHGDRWHEVFHQEFESLWSGATPADEQRIGTWLRVG